MIIIRSYFITSGTKGGEPVIDLNIKVTPVGDLYINGQYYRQLCFDGVAIGMAIDDYLKGEPADNVDN